jgi:hypothetical protein
MGTIMAVDAALEMNMDTKAVVTMKPNIAILKPILFVHFDSNLRKNFKSLKCVVKYNPFHGFLMQLKPRIGSIFVKYIVVLTIGADL